MKTNNIAHKSKKLLKILVGSDLWHVLAQLSQAEAQPLDEQQGTRGSTTQAGHAMAQVGEAHSQQPCPGSQTLPSGVAIAYDCQHKGCLGSRVGAAGAVITV